MVFRIVQVDVVKLLADHQVGEEASLGSDEISTPERHLEFIAEPGIVCRARVEIAGGGQVNISSPAGISISAPPTSRASTMAASAVNVGGADVAF
jgi:hypothetical protein